MSPPRPQATRILGLIQRRGLITHGDDDVRYGCDVDDNGYGCGGLAMVMVLVLVMLMLRVVMMT